MFSVNPLDTEFYLFVLYIGWCFIVFNPSWHIKEYYT